MSGSQQLLSPRFCRATLPTELCHQLSDPHPWRSQRPLSGVFPWDVPRHPRSSPPCQALRLVLRARWPRRPRWFQWLLLVGGGGGATTGDGLSKGQPSQLGPRPCSRLIPSGPWPQRAWPEDVRPRIYEPGRPGPPLVPASAPPRQLGGASPGAKPDNSFLTWETRLEFCSCRE